MPFCRWWLTGHPARGATTHLRLARGWRWRFWPPPGCALARAASLPYCDPASNHTAITPNTHRAPVVPGVPRGASRAHPRGCALPPASGAGARSARGMGNRTRTTRDSQVRGARERTALGLHQHTSTRRALSASSLPRSRPGAAAPLSLSASFRPSLHAQSSLAPPRAGEAFRITSAERGLGLAERRAARTPHAPRRASHDHPRAERPSRVTTRPKRRCEAEDREDRSARGARSEGQTRREATTALVTPLLGCGGENRPRPARTTQQFVLKWRVLRGSDMDRTMGIGQGCMTNTRVGHLTLRGQLSPFWS